MRCHSASPYCEQSDGVIYNYDYSRTWGEEITKDCPDNIRKAFKFINEDTRLPQTNCDLIEAIGSAHDLKNIRGYMRGKWGWSDTNSELNPCCTCHNPHKATKEYPCSLASDHSNTWEIWGDESGERMTDYVGSSEIYQPPYQAGKTTYERGADTQPNYVKLCLECHQYQQNSYQHGTVMAIDWGNDVGMGKGAAALSFAHLKPPYLQANEGQYVLCCTDCHEPHGSRNEWLLRTEVNGTIVQINTSNPLGYWFDFCTACHDGVEETKHGWQGEEVGWVCFDNNGCHGHGKVGGHAW